MSAETVWTRSPPPNLAAACLRRYLSTAQMLTFAPEANRRCATPNPIPWDPPVTIAVRPAKSSSLPVFGGIGVSSTSQRNSNLFFYLPPGRRLAHRRFGAAPPALLHGGLLCRRIKLRWLAPDAVPPQPAAGDRRTVGERAKFFPYDVFSHHRVARHGRKTAIGAGDDARRVAAHDVDEQLDPIGDHLRVLDVIGGDVDHAGNQNHAPRRRLFLQCLPIMLVARIGAGKAQRADFGPIDDGQEWRKIDIIDMWAIPVAKTNMQPDFRRRNIGKCKVHRLDMDLDTAEE